MTSFDELPPERKAQIEKTADAIDQLMDKLDEIASPDLHREVVGLRDEVKRLTEALAASDADRDRMAQQLALAQSEARGLREELRRISAPNGGVA